MSKRGNQAFGNSILKRVETEAEEDLKTGRQTENPATHILENRETALSEMATGKLLPDGNRLVDPAICRIWTHHNRDEEWLSEENCSDLIASIKSDGRQTVPAIVRRVKGDPDHQYEVIAGRRRHWAVSWLRANHHENVEFLITVQNLSDQAAFRVADFENRARKDISDIERAKDYAFGLKEFYNNSQSLMAERLGISATLLNRYLQLARLDEDILAAFPSRYEVSYSNAGKLAPHLRKEDERPLMLIEAKRLAEYHAQAKAEGKKPMTATEVVRRLIASTISKKAVSKIEPVEFKTEEGKPMMTAQAQPNGAISVKIHPKSGAHRREMLAAFAEVIDDI